MLQLQALLRGMRPPSLGYLRQVRVLFVLQVKISKLSMPETSYFDKNVKISTSKHTYFYATVEISDYRND